jgi:hypothetical protein
MAELTKQASSPDCIFGTKAGQNNGKSEPSQESLPASAPYAHNAAPQKSGKTETEPHHLATLFNGGSAKNAV